MALDKRGFSFKLVFIANLMIVQQSLISAAGPAPRVLTFLMEKTMKNVSFNQKNAKGFSLVELLLVLGVLAILLVAAFVVFPQVRDRNQANAEVTNLTTIKAGASNLYASRGGDYTGLTNTVAIDARLFPTSMPVTGTGASRAVTSSWGQPVTVAAADAADGGPRRFNITYNAVPPGVCLGMVAGAATNFEQVTVGTTAVITDGTTATELSAGGRFDPAAAATACGVGTPQNIVFRSN